jgi:hypothetical protein
VQSLGVYRDGVLQGFEQGDILGDVVVLVSNPPGFPCDPPSTYATRSDIRLLNTKMLYCVRFVKQSSSGKLYWLDASFL